MANTTATDALSLPWERLIDKSTEFDEIRYVKYAGISRWINSLATKIETKGSWWRKPKKYHEFKDLYTYDELLDALVLVAASAAHRPPLNKRDCKLMLDTLIDLNLGTNNWQNDTVGGWAIRQVTDGFVIRYQIQGQYKEPLRRVLLKE